MLIIIMCVIALTIVVLTIVTPGKNRTNIDFVILVLMAVITITLVLGILAENGPGSERKAKMWSMRRDPIVYQIENNDVDGALVGEIISFNKDLANAKRRHESVVTNWFVGNYIEEFDFIQMPSTKTMR